MLRKKIILPLSFMLLVGAGCSKDSTSTENISETEVTSEKQNEMEELSEKSRIISTNSATTEILVGLGITDEIIAVDTYSSLEGLDEDILVMDFLAPDIEAIIDLEPDTVFYTNYYGGTDNPFVALTDLGIEIIEVPTSTSIDGIYEDILFYGEKTNTSEKAELIVSDMKKEVDKIRKIGSGIEEKESIYFEVDSFEGTLYSTGNDTYINDIIESIGATNIFVEETSWIVPTEESIVEKNPDVIATGNTFNENILEEIKSRQSFSSTNAILNDRVYLVNGDRISKGTQNIVDSMKEMAELIYPDYYDYEW